MARRCLIFRPDEAVWECATECHCECALFQKTGYQSRLISDLWDHKVWNRMTTSNGWMWRIEEFSKRDFTVPTDRLVALASVTKFVGRTLGYEQYFAGLWRGFLGFHLAWVGFNPVQEYDEYVAPSWSWASYKSNVKFLTYPEGGLSLGRNFGEADEISAWCKPSGINRLGAVDDCLIVMQGSYCTAVLSTPGGLFNTNEEDLYTDFQLQLENQTVHGTSMLECSLDRVLSEAHDSIITDGNHPLLTVAPWRNQDSHPRFAGRISLFRITTRSALILIPSRKTASAFERVGIWTFESSLAEDEQFFAKWESCNVKLV